MATGCGSGWAGGADIRGLLLSRPIRRSSTRRCRSCGTAYDRRARRSIRRSRCGFCFPRTACRKRSCAMAIPISTRSNKPLQRCLAAWRRNDLDWKICYQLRATPQQWITPITDAEITRAGHDRTAVLVVPIAFVSEHSETLVELDVDYNELAHRCGVPGYFRVPTHNSNPGSSGRWPISCGLPEIRALACTRRAILRPVRAATGGARLPCAGRPHRPSSAPYEPRGPCRHPTGILRSAAAPISTLPRRKTPAICSAVIGLAR